MLRGDDVAELQRLLGALGFDAGRVDGIFGTRTADAIAEFQRNAGLTTDGICGPDTVDGAPPVRGRDEGDGPSSTVASLREAEGLRRSSRLVVGLRVAVADGGGVGALADALARALTDRGAVVTVVHHPDESSQAAAANAFDAGVFLALAAREQTGVTCGFYAHDGLRVGRRAPAGRRSPPRPSGRATCRARSSTPRPMRLPVLRETRMPAVLVEVGPPSDRGAARTGARGRPGRGRRTLGRRPPSTTRRDPLHRFVHRLWTSAVEVDPRWTLDDPTRIMRWPVRPPGPAAIRR